MRDAIENILAGMPTDLSIELLMDSLLDLEPDDDLMGELEELIEKRVCRRGPAMKRRIRGRIVTMHRRICTGKPGAAASSRARTAARSSRAARKRGQRNRWMRKRR